MSAHPVPRLLIDGTWIEGVPGSQVVDPATEQVVAQVPRATDAEIDAALASTAKGFSAWRAMTPARRGEVIRAAAALVRDRVEDFAAVITTELGKPLREARAETLNAAAIIEWNADEGQRTYGRVIPGPAERRQLVVSEPVGPVAAFSPWNAPVQSPARKISSTLAAGCSVIIKPAEETPGAAVLLAQAFLDAGLPDGALTVLFGNPAHISGRLLDAPEIRAVTFTGSTAVGRVLAGAAGTRLKRAVMELGGYAPVVVCADAPIESVAAEAAVAANRNAGQVCTSPTRFLVDATVYEQFLDTFSARVAALTVGSGLDPATQVGPVATERRLAAVEHLVRDAQEHGAQVTAGGRRREGPGWFWEPTVLAGVGPDAAVAQEEPFGPISTVASFEHLDDAVAAANSVPFALAGYVFTAASATALELTTRLECGAIAVNHWQVSAPSTPFGGHKDSGFGAEGGSEGVAAFSTIKFVSEQ
jgi:succinate-semialdehyde dehydrogenase/glutarate-semialdehyde dehydrogenase